MRHLIFLCILFFSCDSSTQPVLQSTPDQDQRSVLYRSTDQGKTWAPFGEGLPSTIQASFLANYENELLLATDNEGLFISEGRSRWRKLSSLSIIGEKVNAIHVHQGIIYLGMYNKGIFVSRNKGETWENWTYNLGDLKVQAICFYDDQLFVGTDSAIEKFNLDNKTWETLFSGVQVVSLETTSDKMIAGTSRGTLLSIDSGSNWDWIHQQGAVHYTRLVQDRIVEFSISGPVYISDNWGKSWLKAEYAPWQRSYVYEMAAVENAWILSNNYGVHKSWDHGKTWDLIFPNKKFFFFDLLVSEDMIIAGTRD